MEGHGEGTHSGSAHGEVLSFIAKQVLAFKPCALLLLGEFGANDFSCRVRNAVAARGGRSVTTLTNRHMLKMCSRHSVYNAATKLARCCLLGWSTCSPASRLLRNANFFVFVNKILGVVFRGHSCLWIWRADSHVNRVITIHCLVVNKSMGPSVAWTACLAAWTSVGRLALMGE